MLLKVDRQQRSGNENETRSRDSRQEPEDPGSLEGPARKIEFRSHFGQFQKFVSTFSCGLLIRAQVAADPRILGFH